MSYTEIWKDAKYKSVFCPENRKIIDDCMSGGWAAIAGTNDYSLGWYLEKGDELIDVLVEMDQLLTAFLPEISFINQPPMIYNDPVNGPICYMYINTIHPIWMPEPNPFYLYGTPPDKLLTWREYAAGNKTKSCTCGCAAIGFKNPGPRHSDWCDIYSPDGDEEVTPIA